MIAEPGAEKVKGDPDSSSKEHGGYTTKLPQEKAGVFLIPARAAIGFIVIISAHQEEVMEIMLIFVFRGRCCPENLEYLQTILPFLSQSYLRNSVLIHKR